MEYKNSVEKKCVCVCGVARLCSANKMIIVVFGSKHLEVMDCLNSLEASVLCCSLLPCGSRLFPRSQLKHRSFP